MKNGAKNPIAAHVLSMFSEAKHAQSEQKYEMPTASLSQQSTSTEETIHNIVLPNPVEKQFTLRVCGKLIPKGTGGPQFMRYFPVFISNFLVNLVIQYIFSNRAIIKNDEFRLCGAFSQDTTFL